jgi:hypothetical protein
VTQVERGVYFDAWFPRQHNYHPSLPPRRLRMIDDLEEYRATMLVWAALGGGAISLPYLEEESGGDVPARFRFYGFVNDSEFMAECGRRGIKVFGVVFEHAWEFPVELNEAEDRVLSLNEPLGVGHRDWLGMREFWQNRYPVLWPPRQKYFPEPVVNALGEEVTDILEECAQRDIFGEPCHALWIECPDREHWNWMMDRNNPVWREYLKAVVRIQIDAGVQGVHFDESEVPLTSLQYGGCFCDTCTRGFREYLQDAPPDRLPEDLRGQDLSSFHYGRYLLDRGFDFRSNRASTPLFFDYVAFQQQNIKRYFAELAEYTREYAASVGRDVLISGNFFNLFDHYYALEPSVDVIVTEMRNTLWRFPEWYRYAAGFGGRKPVVVVENPYGGVVMEMVEALKQGRMHDRFRQSIYEAAALGVNMSVPYGSWMGSVVEDAFYAPHDVATEIQRFIADHEHLYGRDPTYAEVGVVYGITSNAITRSAAELPADNRLNVMAEGDVLPFDRVSRLLCAAMQPYDVLFFPDGELRQDSLVPGDLARYRTLVVPGCDVLTGRQGELLERFVGDGGRLVVAGDLGTNLGDRMRTLLERAEVVVTDAFGFELDLLPNGLQVELVGEWTDAALTLQRVDGGCALHLIRYDYDEAHDRVPALGSRVLDVRLPFDPDEVEAFSPDDSFVATATPTTDRGVRLTLQRVPLYGIVWLPQPS